MILDSIHRLAFRIIVAFMALGFVACVIIGATLSVTFAAYIFGGITLGPVLTVLVRQISDYRAGRSLDVLGRDVAIPRAVLRERVPSGPATPTRWRNERGHRRYGLDRNGGAE